MWQNFLLIIIIVSIAIIGLIIKLIDISNMQSRREFTIEFFNNLNSLIGTKVNGAYDNQTYIWLTERVDKMQKELGVMGIYSMIDNLAGIKTDNYPVLLNFLPEIASFNEIHNSILYERFAKSAQTCRDTLHKT